MLFYKVEVTRINKFYKHTACPINNYSELYVHNFFISYAIVLSILDYLAKNTHVYCEKAPWDILKFRHALNWCTKALFGRIFHEDKIH